MEKARVLALLLVFVCSSPPVLSQGMMEGTFVRGMGAGLGAGTAASMNHGKVVRRTYESMIQAQQAAIAQTKVVEQYVTAGCQLEAKKQWANAEQYFAYALQMIAKRDGPGSPKSVPVLEHLAKISKNQNKIDQAIGYQKTVVAFANAARPQNAVTSVQAQTDLTRLFMDKGDYSKAETVAKQSADLVRQDHSISPTTYRSTLKVYGVVLRKLNREAEANSIDAELASEAAAKPSATAAANTTPAQSESASPVAAVAPPAVPADSSVSKMPEPAAAIASEESKSTTAALPQGQSNTVVSSSATTPAAPSAVPPGAVLSPPTADWPVINSDGKVESEAAAPDASGSPAAASTPSAPAVPFSADSSPPPPASAGEPAVPPPSDTSNSSPATTAPAPVPAIAPAAAAPAPEPVVAPASGAATPEPSSGQSAPSSSSESR